jgi:hypothetical protein
MYDTLHSFFRVAAVRYDSPPVGECDTCASPLGGEIYSGDVSRFVLLGYWTVAADLGQFGIQLCAN